MDVSEGEPSGDQISDEDDEDGLPIPETPEPEPGSSDEETLIGEAEDGLPIPKGRPIPETPEPQHGQSTTLGSACSARLLRLLTSRFAARLCPCPYPTPPSGLALLIRKGTVEPKGEHGTK